MGGRLVVVARRCVPLLWIGDGQDSLLPWPWIVGRPGLCVVLCQQLRSRAIGLCAVQRRSRKRSRGCCQSFQKITSLHSPPEIFSTATGCGKLSSRVGRGFIPGTSVV